MRRGSAGDASVQLWSASGCVRLPAPLPKRRRLWRSELCGHCPSLRRDRVSLPSSVLYVRGTLSLRGVRPLGDTEFEPVYAELDKKGGPLSRTPTLSEA